MELIGWIGSVLLACCGAPQAWMSYKQKHSRGISWGFLSLWMGGEILTLIYITPTLLLPLVLNYTFNILILTIIIYYKVRGNKNDKV